MNVRKVGLVALLASSSLILPAMVASCGDDTTSPAGGGGAGGAATGGAAAVIYEGLATDEALDALLAEAAVEDAAQSVHFTSPSAGATLSQSPPAFAWRVGEPTGANDRPRDVRLGASPAASSAAAAPALATIAGSLHWLLSERQAHAHGAPVNGRAYLLEIRNGEQVVYRVFTTNLDHTPSSEAWTAVAAGGGARTASVLSAIFENNRVAQDGGPFLGVDLTFTVEP